jgi:hypothetical protein
LTATRARAAPAAPPPPPPPPGPPAGEAALIPAIAELRRIGRHRYGLYLFVDRKGQPLGFAEASYGPFVAPEIGRELIDAELCYFDETGGAHGSIKVTAAGRDALSAGTPDGRVAA